MIFSPLLNQIESITHGFGTKLPNPPLPEKPEPWLAKQVHSDRWVELGCDGEIPASRSIEADAVITLRHGQPIAVRTADCVPILMVDSDVGCIAVVHAGWKGTAARICEKIIEGPLKEKGIDPVHLKVAIGPCISGQHYEVGEDVAKHFVGAGSPRPQIAGAEIQPSQPKRLLRRSRPTPLHETANGKYLFDLVAANRSTLLDAGVLPEHIDVIDLCTFERDDLFYSYRRDGEGTGRQISWIQLL